jgi:hypothetical protein
MKAISFHLIIILFSCSCTVSTQQQQEQPDTVQIQETESTIITSNEDAEEPQYSSPDFYDSTFDIKSPLAMKYLEIFGDDEVLTSSLLNDLYDPYYYREGPAENPADPAFIITDVKLLNLSLLNKKGGCSDIPILTTYRNYSSSGEGYYDFHFLSMKNNQIYSTYKLTFTGEFAQSSSEIKISEKYKLSQKCQVLAIEEDSEGGDINLSRGHLITFYLLNESTPLEILTITMEDTTVLNYFETNDENKDATSTLGTIEVLSTVTNALYDIKVTYTKKADGKVTDKNDVIYKFDGTKYQSTE